MGRERKKREGIQKEEDTRREKRGEGHSQEKDKFYERKRETDWQRERERVKKIAWVKKERG